MSHNYHNALPLFISKKAYKVNLMGGLQYNVQLLYHVCVKCMRKEENGKAQLKNFYFTIIFLFLREK